MSKNNERIEHLKEIVSALPECPGSYQYYDKTGTIIYVGKAKNLKRRVSSYFNKDQANLKTAILVSKIADIKYIVVKTEEDALLLENNLIKKYKPRYNVLLKDGKTYPSICITREPYPRIYRTRKINLKHADYYGPYSHIGVMNTIYELLTTQFLPRPCQIPMTTDGVLEGRYKPCLNFQIKKCLAPCIGHQKHAEYLECIEECRAILKGNTDDILRKLRAEMMELAAQMRFEEAQTIKERYDTLQAFQAKSTIVHPSNTNLDVFHIESDERNAFINYLHVVKGSITQAYTLEYKKSLNETDAEVLAIGIVELRERFRSTSHEIIVPFAIDLPIEGVSLTIPQRGEKHKLLELSKLNVMQYKFDRLKQAEKLNPEQRQTRLMKEIQEALNLPNLPLQIELFDNSNIQGSSPVAACVVFKRLKPSKKDYRKYNIKTVVGPDDYASMQEVVRRRYTRLMEEGQTLPNLIITDGGRGQMECVRKVVEDELGLQIPIAGLAKDNRHRTNELLYGFPPIVVGVKPTSELFKVLTQMQDEVHRFAITFHREKRAKAQVHSALDEIKGIGPATRQALIKQFKSVKRISEAPLEALADVIGAKKAELVYNALHVVPDTDN